MAYADKTKVSVSDSKYEIERILTKYKANDFGYYTNGENAIVQFRFDNRVIKFLLKLPDPKSREFTHHSRGQRDADAAIAQWEQACRQKWRALTLVIKAKLEAVDAGISTLENEFLANTLLPDGQLYGDYSKPQIDESYLTGKMPSGLQLTYQGE